jgi:D-lyxose ketol-isomerase
MKRSEINAILRDALSFLREHKSVLPPFAYWSPGQWKQRRGEADGVIRQQLGWDITDFGSGDFDRVGLFLFTVRNGTLDDAAQGGKNYAEKILIVREQQLTPAHFHFKKMEDIINRGGGELVIQLWKSTKDESLDEDSEVTVQIDSMPVTVPAGGKVSLEPGQSITLPPFLYHAFWAAPGKGTVLVGEVSRVNDDRTDNRFATPVGRFPTIEEDEPPLHLLTIDYAGL